MAECKNSGRSWVRLPPRTPVKCASADNGRRVLLISGARFLRLSATAQSLYFHLNTKADDNGIVEAFAVLNKVRAAEQDLVQLVDAEFISIINKL